MSAVWRTCREHDHCQEEITVSEWDDKPNDYVVRHHRNADSQFDSPVSPEKLPRTSETAGLRVQVLDLEERIATLESLVIGSRAARRAARKAL